MMPLLVVICVLLIVVIIVQFLFRPKQIETIEYSSKLEQLSLALNRLETNIKDDFRTNREENASIAKDNRSELNNTLKEFKTELSQTLSAITLQNQKALELINKTLDEKVDALTKKMDENNIVNRESLSAGLKDFTIEQRNRFSDLKEEQKEFTKNTIAQLEKITTTIEERLNALNIQAKDDNKQMRDALAVSFKGFEETFNKNGESFNNLLRERFSQLDEKQMKLVESTEKKLEEMRVTVDEKLQKTLNERLGQSFELVGKQLESVQKGLGEMQTLAQDVGGLKRVLSNVKMRGGIGEVQLAMLLEQVLAPEQYEANVKTKLLFIPK